MKTQIKPPQHPLAVRACRECHQRFGPGPSHFERCIHHKTESIQKAEYERGMKRQMQIQRCEEMI